MTHNKYDPAIIVALDVPDSIAALELTSQLDPHLCRVKVGMELFDAAGPRLIEDLHEEGFNVFLDLKLKDIPNTVASTAQVLCDLGVWAFNLHTDGGSKMLLATMETIRQARHRPHIIGVTVLTSMDYLDLREVGVPTPKKSTLPHVIKLATLAKKSGLNGVVCSGEEASEVRRRFGKDFIIMTPGIRLPDGNKDDQKRIVTPEIAIQNGADYLVVGRPITRALHISAALADFDERVRLARADLT